MNIICLEGEAFDALIGKVIVRIREKDKKEDKWIADGEACVSSALQTRLRCKDFAMNVQSAFPTDEKVIVYDTNSINEYLDKHAKKAL